MTVLYKITFPKTSHYSPLCFLFHFFVILDNTYYSTADPQSSKCFTCISLFNMFYNIGLLLSVFCIYIIYTHLCLDNIMFLTSVSIWSLLKWVPVEQNMNLNNPINSIKLKVKSHGQSRVTLKRIHSW